MAKKAWAITHPTNTLPAGLARAVFLATLKAWGWRPFPLFRPTKVMTAEHEKVEQAVDEKPKAAIKEEWHTSQWLSWHLV